MTYLSLKTLKSAIMKECYVLQRIASIKVISALRNCTSTRPEEIGGHYFQPPMFIELKIPLS